jgi:hypothetical protein
MRGGTLTKIAVLTIVIIFALASGLALAAGKSYCVIKGKDNVCKVIKCDKATPATIKGGGPFPTKEAAEKVKAECQKAAAKQPKAEKKTLK